MTFSVHDEIIGVVPHLRAFARSLTGDADRADDLVQDTVVRALNAAEQFTPGTNFKAWTFTILRNLHVNNLRRRKFVAEPGNALDLELIGIPPSQESSLALHELRRSLLRLSVEHREVLLLIGASGFSYEDAARICNCAVGTIKSRLCRARRELAKLMGLNEEADRPAETAQPARRRVARLQEQVKPAAGKPAQGVEAAAADIGSG